MEAGELPFATYALADGTAYAPASYFDEACTFEDFTERLSRAAASRNLSLTAEDMKREWDDFLTDAYGACLRVPCPESIVDKAWLIEQIERLLAASHPKDQSWRTAIAELVDHLDRLEAQFTLFD